MGLELDEGIDAARARSGLAHNIKPDGAPAIDW
jgi:hypothetical protein